jgi:hypothetical protein
MTHRRSTWLGACAALLLAASVSAQEPGATPDSEHLLARARLIDSLDVTGSTRLVLDGEVIAEGGSAGARGFGMVSAAASLTFDLGADVPLAAVYMQADGHHRYSLQVSENGTTFREVWAAPVPSDPSERRGMRARFTPLFGVHGRYVRFGEPEGFGATSVSEFRLYDNVPAEWPPRFAVAPTPAPTTGASAAGGGFRFTRGAANQLKMLLAFAGAALLLWSHRSKQRGTDHRHKRLRDGLLLALGIVGFTGYFNWGAYHFPQRAHIHEFFHYYVGAKYFPELGYTGLYECANVAEAEQGFRRRVELRKIRNLRENERVSAAYVLEDPERWKQGFIRPFTPERWESFKHDIAYFRDRSGVEAWEHALQDHGYNPSPMWNVAGFFFSNLGPASDALIDGFLAWIDPLLLLVAFGFITWAFGWRIAAVAALFFGTNEPALYFWTGGAFLRQDWFLCAMVGICLLQRGKPALGGASLAVSTLLRVFPAGFFVGIGLRFLWLLVAERRIDRTGLRIILGAAVATAILVPVSSMVAGGFQAWPEFVRNTAKHAATPLTNNMGLHTVVAFRWESRQKVMYDPSQADPFHNFREARKEAFRGPLGRSIFLLAVAGYLALLFVVARREMEWWVLAAFGFGVIPIVLELTCYYYSFLTAAALVGKKREGVSIGLLALAGVSQFIEFQTYYYDMRYTLESLAVLVFIVAATWSYARRPIEEAGGDGARPAAAPATP